MSPSHSLAPQLGRNYQSLVAGAGAVRDATYIPRKEGVSDGAWKQADAEAVEEALQDGARIVKDGGLASKGAEVLLGKSLEELKEFAESRGQPKFRGQQLQDGLVKNLIRDIGEFSNLPKAWRQELLDSGVKTGRSELFGKSESPDGTVKLLLKLHDGRVVEAVGIPPEKDAKGPQRLTACISSQVGCPMRCTFCATGKGGFARNLMPHEIIDQVLHIQEYFGKRVSNIVFMGMGEPMLNLPSVMSAHGFINKTLGIGARHITISTVGVPNTMRKLADYDTQATLAISLHAPTQSLRETLVPSARAYPLEAIMHDAEAYFQATSRRVSFEYTLIDGVNATTEQAKQLAALIRARDMAAHVNLIPWNPVDESDFKRPSRNAVFRFKNTLEACNISASIRITRGLDAAAACGQLRNIYQKNPLIEGLESHAAAA
eukprot:CAMPEP_0177589028 /NCGR_PEP_ID=MMETSP0419_2-20121207/6564_1 /TAXON_ID=582737 /ORGANISM="Tetraselmis sp., Strain GSL018" /LENGTH=431 /DNA_ID=CAMNT_0019079313 /DNA_START=236 /DNA_END=1532 /DNA_ORIENTATION=-